MNERESVQLDLMDSVMAVGRVLDGCLNILPAAAHFLRPRPASLVSKSGGPPLKHAVPMHPHPTAET